MQEGQDSSSSALHVRGLARRMGRHWALRRVDLDLAEGSSLAVVGPNGSGKTTLLRVLSTALSPSRGTLEVFGAPQPGARRLIRPDVALLSHASFLYGGLSGRENLELVDRLLSRPAAPEAVGSLLTEVGLEDAADRGVATYSAGMKKRLSLARLLYQRPRLALLDEPFSALDPGGYRLMESKISELRDAGCTVVLSTHQLDRALALCSDVVVLQSGKVAWSGPSKGSAERVRTLVEGGDGT